MRSPFSLSPSNLSPSNLRCGSFGARLLLQEGFRARAGGFPHLGELTGLYDDNPPSCDNAPTGTRKPSTARTRTLPDTTTLLPDAAPPGWLTQKEPHLCRMGAAAASQARVCPGGTGAGGGTGETFRCQRAVGWLFPGSVKRVPLPGAACPGQRARGGVSSVALPAAVADRAGPAAGGRPARRAGFPEVSQRARYPAILIA